MSTVGQLLKEERLKKGFTLEQVEKATRIRARFILALEDDEYSKLPASPYVQGFVKNYGDFLGMRSSTLLALFRRQFAQKQQKDRKIIEEPLTPRWQLTPNKVIAAIVFILILSLFGYFYSQYQALHRPPPLLVENPKTDQVTRDETIAVFGTTDTDATLTINHEPVLIKEGGKFFKEISLTPGSNTLVIESTNRVGEKTTQVKNITRITN